MRIWKAEYTNHAVSIRVYEYLYSAIRIRAAMKRIRSRLVPAAADSELCDEIITIIEDAKVLEAGMADWGLDIDWRQRRVSPTAFPHNVPLAESFTLTVRFYFPSQDIAGLWFRYYVARMKLHESLVDGLVYLSQSESLSSFTERSGRNVHILICEHEEIIRWAVDSFLGGTAFALGEVNDKGKVFSANRDYDWSNGLPELDCQSAIRLLVPLQDLRHSIYVTSLQRQAIESLFIRISREMRFLWAVAPGYAPVGITIGE